MPETKPLKAFARRMRWEPTGAERRLWHNLRFDQRGCKFRRQLPLGPYIADFACLSHRMVIEVDGHQHAEHPYDDQRDQ